MEAYCSLGERRNFRWRYLCKRLTWYDRPPLQENANML